VCRHTDRPQEALLVEALLRADAYDHPVEAIELVETHISWVLLTGTYAYKIKKPARFPFLDFSTLERRKKFCDEELRLNRRLAPTLYLDVVPIGGSAENPKIGQLPAIEYAVKMRQFPGAAQLDRKLALGTVKAEDLRGFAATLADFHARLEPAPADTRLGSPAIIIRTALNNVRDLEDATNDTDLDALGALGDWTETQCVRLEDAFTRRKRAGAIRECHGDLHLRNLVHLDDRIVAFDALEFEPELRWMDVMSEAAFLTMDLIAHGRGDLAHEFLSRYLECSGDYAGFDVLPFYLVYRALVRAKVEALRKQQSPSTAGQISYVRLAAELIAHRDRPMLVITHGLSGSGKSTVAESLIGSLPAVRIRSDLERKRLHGFAAGADSRSGVATGIYDARASERTYAALERYAALGLEAGLNIIVDAAFLRRAERDVFAALAARFDARFVMLDCQCSEVALRDRIARRRAARQDPSEATIDALAYQFAHSEPLAAEEHSHVVSVATGQAIDVADLRRRIAGDRG
jgi:aminoglycoside phosphotransferase family enzyme/predicted kinase